LKAIKSFASKKPQIEDWLSMIEFASSPASTLKVTGPGKSEVMLVENNADDSVRNLEHSVLKLISSAKKNVRAYNMLAYHSMVAKAFADAGRRLAGNPFGARMILDATLVYPLNQLFESMLKQEIRFDPTKPQNRLKYEDTVSVDLSKLIRWRRFLSPIFQKSQGLIDVEPQQHTKTIVVDDLYTLLGSSNFDLNSMKGAFREFSVIIKDQKVARESGEIFDSIWSNPNETVDSVEIVELKKLPEMGGAKPLSDSIRSELMKAAQFESDRNETINPRNFKRRGDFNGPLDSGCF
jgi:phosphatidylserine/phosphatidylglycerophosphate/cardiolipin synthase-like enzyme